MDLPVELFSLGWHLVAALISLATLGWVGATAPWARLNDPLGLHLVLGCGVTILGFWLLKAGVQPGLNLHVLGAMAATLILGPQLALVALGLALTAITLNGPLSWGAWPLNFVVMIAWPVLWAWTLHRWVARNLPKNFFVFVFVTSFLGAALTVIASGLLAAFALSWAGAYPFGVLAEGYLPYFLLLGFSEAWFTGGALTLLVIYRPGWVCTFDDRQYFPRV